MTQSALFCNNPLADVYRDTGKRIDHNGLDERMSLSQCNKPSDWPAQSKVHKQQMEHIHTQRDAGYFTDHELHLVGTALENGSSVLQSINSDTADVTQSGEAVPTR